MRFFNTEALTFPRDGTAVQWMVEPENTDLSTVEVVVERSESPMGPFVEVQVVDPLTVFSFRDKTAPWRPKNWELYYRLRGVDRSSGDDVHVGEVFGFQGNLPLDALEIIRQHKILLEGVNGHEPYNGRPCSIFKRRNFGPRCRDCVDASTGQVVISQCPSCGGTGYQGTGYYDPIDNVLMNISPNRRSVQSTTLARQEDNETAGFMLNFPVLYDGDIIVEPNERHWRVMGSEVTERVRQIVHQTLRLRQLDHNDVEYETLLHSSHRST